MNIFHYRYLHLFVVNRRAKMGFFHQSRPFFCSVSGLYTECGLKNPLGFTSSSGCHRVLELLLVSSTSGGMSPDLTLLLIQTITKQCGLQSLFGRASSFHLQEDRLDVWCFLRVSSAGWCCLPVNVCPSHAYFLFPCDSTYLVLSPEKDNSQ